MGSKDKVMMLFCYIRDKMDEEHYMNLGCSYMLQS